MCFSIYLIEPYSNMQSLGTLSVGSKGHSKYFGLYLCLGEKIRRNTMPLDLPKADQLFLLSSKSHLYSTDFITLPTSSDGSHQSKIETVVLYLKLIVLFKEKNVSNFVSIWKGLWILCFWWKKLKLWFWFCCLDKFVVIEIASIPYCVKVKSWNCSYYLLLC